MRSQVILLLAALSLAGCSREKAAPAKPSSSDKVILSTTVARNSAFNMAIAFDPSPPRMSSKTRFRLTLTDLSSAPVGDAKVGVALVMPLMDMGKNEFSMQPAGQGVYEGTAQFTMSGEWEVMVSAAAGGKSGKTTFNVRVED